MTKKEINLLKHLTKATEYADTYFCGIAKNNKNKFMYTVEDSIKTCLTLAVVVCFHAQKLHNEAGPGK